MYNGIWRYGNQSKNAKADMVMDESELTN
jgi:hypothetical protein